MVNTDIDDKDFYAVRKHLNLFSIIILVLAFTNAEISIVNLFGIQVALNGGKLYIALFIGYLYFIWRYFTKLPLMEGFWSKFLKFYLDSNAGVKKQHTFDRYRDSILNNSPDLKQILETDTNSHLVSFTVLPLKGRSILSLRLSATFYVTVNKFTGEAAGSNMSADHDIVVKWHFMARKFLVFCLRQDQFGDYIFPIIPVLINLGFFFFKDEWQGNLFALMSE